MLIPSIDLSRGKAVQLRQGRQKVLERPDIDFLARSFSKFGELAVIDLDAASGEGDNEDLVLELCRRYECRVGGGIRSPEKARRLFEAGATKVIVGTAAFERGAVCSRFLEELVQAVGRERIIVALDNIRGRIVVDGWRREAGLEVIAAVKNLEPFASEFLLTCVEREGLMAGTDIEAVRQARAATRLPLIASGGVAAVHEVGTLSKLGVHVQLGMALHTGTFSVEDAFLASLDWEKAGGFVPTVVQDASSQVLMLAWSSPESLARTFRSGRVWYYSRSRNTLWRKGETSGNERRARRRSLSYGVLFLLRRQAFFASRALRRHSPKNQPGRSRFLYGFLDPVCDGGKTHGGGWRVGVGRYA